MHSHGQQKFGTGGRSGNLIELTSNATDLDLDGGGKSEHWLKDEQTNNSLQITSAVNFLKMAKCSKFFSFDLCF